MYGGSYTKKTLTFFMGAVCGVIGDAFAEAPSCNQTLTNVIGNSSSVGYVYRNNANSQTKSGTTGLATRYITTKNTFAANYTGIGVVTGHARCSTAGTNPIGVWSGATNPEDVTALDGTDVPDQTGSAKRCYCHAEYFFGANGVSQQLNSKWVFRNEETSNSNCTSNCARYCALSMSDGATNHVKYRNAMFINTEAFCETPGCQTGYVPESGSVVPSSITTATATKYAFVKSDGTSSGSPSGTTAAAYNLTENNSFAVDFGENGVITGFGRCSSQIGFTDDSTTYTWANPIKFYALNDETDVSGARYCYCKIDGYIVNGTKQDVAGMWVYRTGIDSCGTRCSDLCASRIHSGDNYSAFRTALLDDLQMCVLDTSGGTINITWLGASDEDIAANDSATTTYGGDIRTPRAGQHVAGQTFLGWKFVKPSQG